MNNEPIEWWLDENNIAYIKEDSVDEYILTDTEELDNKDLRELGACDAGLRFDHISCAIVIFDSPRQYNLS